MTLRDALEDFEDLPLRVAKDGPTAPAAEILRTLSLVHEETLAWPVRFREGYLVARDPISGESLTLWQF